MTASQHPKARTENLVINDLPDETLVYDLNSNEAHCLNKTAAFVWKSCDGVNSPADISGMIAKEFGANVPDDFVWLALDQLNSNGLLADGANVTKQNRREIIKKIGLASVVALPIIASMVAPKSALAATSCACVNDGECVAQLPQCGATMCSGMGLCTP
ncbi:MAG TPA: PqqD family protein [Pyrinomonadaceae bacterium]|nr:PqqD family protein [Pyrinomonadaceae bacterium]